MSHKILLVGRYANIINLNVESLQTEDVEVKTASSVEEAKALLDDTLDSVIIGAGLEADVRLEVYRILLDQTSNVAVFCNAKDQGAEGLNSMVKLAMHSLKN